MIFSGNPMKKAIIILIIASFFVSWAGPLSGALAAPGDSHGGSHDTADGTAHYCEISKGPCKHKDACPLKLRHSKKSHEHEAPHHHGKDGAVDGPSFIASKCHASSDTHQGGFYTIEHLFITTTLLPPPRWEEEVGFFSRDEPDYSDNISNPFLRPPKSS